MYFNEHEDPFAPDHNDYSGLDVDVDMPGVETPEYDASQHDIRRPHDARRVPLMVLGSIGSVLAATCVFIFVFSLFIRPAAGTTFSAGSGDDVESITDDRASVQLPVYAPGLDTKGSRIPVKVTGNLRDGTPFDKNTYVAYDGSGLKLEPGSYDIYVEGSPISAGGILYVYPTGTVNISVGEDKSVNFNGNTSLIFSEIGALDVTDGQIEAACAFIAKDPERNMYLDLLGERARARREDAIREIEEARKKEEEARKEAEEKARKEQEEQQKQQQKQQLVDENGNLLYDEDGNPLYAQDDSYLDADEYYYYYNYQQGGNGANGSSSYNGSNGGSSTSGGNNYPGSGGSQYSYDQEQDSGSDSTVSGMPSQQGTSASETQSVEGIDA